MTGERNKIIWGEIVARAWRDEAFKQELIANPKQVLTDAGMTVDEGVEVQVVEDTPTTRHLVFPVTPDSALSEEQLESVTGGSSSTETAVMSTTTYNSSVMAPNVTTEVQLMGVVVLV